MMKKTVATLALSALAVNALDSEAYLKGFSQQFGFDQTTVSDAENCIGAIQSTAIGVVQLIQENGGNPLALVGQAQDIIEEIQTTLAASCEPFANDFASEVFQQVGSQDIELVVKQNAEIYFPQLVQKVAQWAHALAAGDDTKAGQTEAYILQVLIGAEQPETLPVPQITQFVEIDQDTFITEYYTAFFKTLGVENVDVDSLKTCAKEIQSFAIALSQLIQQFPNLGYVDRLEAIKNFVVEITPEVEACQGAFEIEKMLFEKALDAAGDDKIGFLLQTIDNLASNFPEYINLKQRAVVEVNNGEYILAGEDDAKSVELIDGGRIFN